MQTEQSLISPFCDEQYFMMAIHFQFQCETLNVDYTAQFNDFLIFKVEQQCLVTSRLSITSSNK